MSALFILKNMKFILLIIFSLAGCSNFKIERWNKDRSEEVKLTYYQEFSKFDYIDHVANFEKVYLTDKKNRVVRLTNKNGQYLESIVKNITQKNELFFNQIKESKFYIVESTTPFHFSLPGRKFFFSTSLVKKYIKNEIMLYCLIVYELIRSERALYNKTVIIPTGTLSTSRILSLLRLDTMSKVEVHKWAFYILKRIGIDTDSYLGWLQIKNRNSLDFALQLGDIQSISREEALFKSFLIEEVKTMKKTTRYKGSSKKFYSFLRNIKR